MVTTVTFDKVGFRRPRPLVIVGDRTWDYVTDRIYRHARPYLPRRGDVTITSYQYEDEMGGSVIVGDRRVTFTIEQES